MLHNCVKSCLLKNIKTVSKSCKQIWPMHAKKFVHNCARMNAKVFIDKENAYAHQVLATSLKPYQIIAEYNDILPAKQFTPAIFESPPENVDIDEMFNNFKILCCYCQQTNSLLSQSEFTNFVKLYCNTVDLLSDEQLKDSLRLLRVLPAEESVRSPNFAHLWNTLDIECCRRIEKWTTDDLLLVCDAWFQLHLAKVCDFVWEALRKLGRKVRKMQPNQLVQTMFMCNVVRRTVFEMIEFEVNMEKCINEMTLEELGVMSMGFFKTQTPIRSQKLINSMYQRLMDELHKVDDITIVSLLKVLRYSSKLTEADIMMKLLDKIFKEKLQDLNLLTCLHVALLSSELQFCHDETIEKIIHRFHDHIDTVRLKDLERISFLISLFNIHTSSKIEESLCEKILQSLKDRIEEIVQYPKCFTNCLHFLSLRGYYDKEMLSTALEENFLKHAAGTKIVFSGEIFHLDTFVKINLLQECYEGPQLLDKYRKKMGKLLTHYIPERNAKYKFPATDYVLLEIKETIDTVLPHNQLKHILPNYDRSDIVICYDSKQRKCIEISEDCPENYSGDILTPELLLGKDDRNGLVTIAIVVAGWNNTVRGKNRFTGLFEMKLKQLEMLGHKHIVIQWHEWRELENAKDRIDFVKRRLSTVIKL